MRNLNPTGPIGRRIIARQGDREPMRLAYTPEGIAVYRDDDAQPYHRAPDATLWVCAEAAMSRTCTFGHRWLTTDEYDAETERARIMHRNIERAERNAQRNGWT